MVATIGHTKRRKVKHNRLLQPGRVRRPPAHAHARLLTVAPRRLPPFRLRAR